jgi:hypothetical protein
MHAYSEMKSKHEKRYGGHVHETDIAKIKITKEE